VALIEELDPNDIGDCEKVLRVLIFSDDNSESFTRLCTRHRQRALAGLGLQTTRFIHQSGLEFLRKMQAHVGDLGDLRDFRVDEENYQASTTSQSGPRLP